MEPKTVDLQIINQAGALFERKNLFTREQLANFLKQPYLTPKKIARSEEGRTLLKQAEEIRFVNSEGEVFAFEACAVPHPELKNLKMFGFIRIKNEVNHA